MLIICYFLVFAIIGQSTNRHLSEAIRGKVEQPLAQQLVREMSEDIKLPCKFAH